MGKTGSSVDCCAPLVGRFSISAHVPNLKSLCPSSSEMRPCTISIGRMLCPCQEYEAGPKRDICSMCGHLSSHHDSSPDALPLRFMPDNVASSSGRAHSVTTLFQRLLKSTPSGATALQETSNGLRKQQVVSTPISNTRVLSNGQDTN